MWCDLANNCKIKCTTLLFLCTMVWSTIALCNIFYPSPPKMLSPCQKHIKFGLFSGHKCFKVEHVTFWMYILWGQCLETLGQLWNICLRTFHTSPIVLKNLQCENVFRNCHSIDVSLVLYFISKNQLGWILIHFMVWLYI
jgi:hypothetical protein